MRPAREYVIGRRKPGRRRWEWWLHEMMYIYSFFIIICVTAIILCTHVPEVPAVSQVPKCLVAYIGS